MTLTFSNSHFHSFFDLMKEPNRILKCKYFLNNEEGRFRRMEYLTYREAERDGIIQSREEKALGRSYSGLPVSKKGLTQGAIGQKAIDLK